MRIVLYNPKSNAAGKRIMPFSLLALGAVLEGRFDYEIVDGNSVGDADAVLALSVQHGASVVGMSVSRAATRGCGPARARTQGGEP